MPFALDPRLEKDCRALGDWPLCRLLLMNDANYPWFILVPRRQDVREIYELSDADRAQLWTESAQLSRAAMQAFAGHKLNVAALGNVVPQLHLHHVVRSPDDPAWPSPVWGRIPAKPYPPLALDDVVQRLRSALPDALKEKTLERVE
jgi:diadenosine tetraphosphate (Ap4A) HIT family hydrolase